MNTADRPTHRQGWAKRVPTAREREIIKLALEGKTKWAIAGEVFVDVKTVESHLANIHRKLGTSGPERGGGKHILAMLRFAIEEDPELLPDWLRP